MKARKQYLILTVYIERQLYQKRLALKQFIIQKPHYYLVIFVYVYVLVWRQTKDKAPSKNLTFQM